MLSPAEAFWAGVILGSAAVYLVVNPLEWMADRKKAEGRVIRDLDAGTTVGMHGHWPISHPKDPRRKSVEYEVRKGGVGYNTPAPGAVPPSGRLSDYTNPPLSPPQDPKCQGFAFCDHPHDRTMRCVCHLANKPATGTPPNGRSAAQESPIHPQAARVALDLHKAAQANIVALWSALRMIREAVEELAPPGSVPNDEYLGPEPHEEAQAIIAGIVALADQKEAAQ